MTLSSVGRPGGRASTRRATPRGRARCRRSRPRPARACRARRRRAARRAPSRRRGRPRRRRRRSGAASRRHRRAELGPVGQAGLLDVGAPGLDLRRVALQREHPPAQVAHARGEPDRRVAPRAAELEHLTVGLRGHEREQELAGRGATWRARCSRGTLRARSSASSASSRASTARMRSSSTGRRPPRRLHARARGEMVVDDPAGLHRCVDRRRPDEPKARFAQLLRERDRPGRRRQPVPARPWRGPSTRYDQTSSGSGAPRPAQRDCRAGVGDRGLDLAPVPHDPGVPEQPCHVRLAELARPARGRSRRTRPGSSRACAGSSATRARTGSPPGKTARTARARPRPAGPTPRRGSGCTPRRRSPSSASPTTRS